VDLKQNSIEALSAKRSPLGQTPNAEETLELEALEGGEWGFDVVSHPQDLQSYTSDGKICL
jgi:hypothetical protein